MATTTTRGTGRGLKPDEEFLQQLYRGGELLAAGKVIEAKDYLERAHQLQPKNEKGQNLLGLAYFKLGLFDRAAEMYEALVRENPADPTLRVNLGLVYLKTNALQRAIREFETATDLAPEHKKAQNYLGLALAQAGEFGRAREHFLLAGSEAMAEKMNKAIAEGKFERPQQKALVKEKGFAEVDGHEVVAERGGQQVDEGARADAASKAAPPATVEIPIDVEESAAARKPDVAAPAAEPPEWGAKPEHEDSTAAALAQVAEASAPSEPEILLEDTAAVGPTPAKAPEPAQTAAPAPEAAKAEPASKAAVLPEPAKTAEPVKPVAATPEVKKAAPEPPKAAPEPAKRPAPEAPAQPAKAAPPPARPPEAKPSPVAAVLPEARAVLPPRAPEPAPAAARAVPPAAAEATEGGPVLQAAAVATIAAPLLAELVPSVRLLPEPVAGPFLVTPELVTLVVRDELLCRTSGLVAISGKVELVPEPKRSRGRATDKPFGEGERQVYRARGQGGLTVDARKQTFTAIDLGDESGYFREELVFAFEEPIMFENGRVPSQVPPDLDLVHLRGKGQVLLQLPGPLKSLEVRMDRPVTVPMSHLVGWHGNLTPRVVPVGVVDPKGKPVRAGVELSGEGFALLALPV